MHYPCTLVYLRRLFHPNLFLLSHPSSWRPSRWVPKFLRRNWFLVLSLFYNERKQSKAIWSFQKSHRGYPQSSKSSSHHGWPDDHDLVISSAMVTCQSHPARHPPNRGWKGTVNRPGSWSGAANWGLDIAYEPKINGYMFSYYIYNIYLHHIIIIFFTSYQSYHHNPCQR